ncbi:50S ribosomal protein L24 [Alphaproteobacteria bacterium]|nr:50S ribosomal protein L24 [Alphaproteobacteria bacterium]
MNAKMKIVKGDKVVVLTGKDKGKTGEVILAIPADRKVVVQGVNVATKHVKPTQESAGGIVKVEKPLDVSNVALVDPKSGKPTRVGIKVAKDGTKTRVAKKSGQEIAKPPRAAAAPKDGGKAKTKGRK